MEKNLITLEFDKIVEKLSTYSLTEMGKAKLQNLRPAQKIEDVINLQNQTEQAKFCYEITTKLPFEQLIDIKDILKKLDIDGILFISEILALLQLTSSTKSTKAYNHLSPLIKEKAALIYTMIEQIYNLEIPAQLILSIINEDGQVKDDASEELLKIRKNIVNKQNTLKNKTNELLNNNSFKNYLQEPIITMRNERYVFPIKAQYRSNVDGIVHDQSSSGITFYIEPISLVHLQNDLNKLLHDEQIEITKILKGLSCALKEFNSQFLYNFETLIDLDIFFAKAKYAIALKAKRPVLTKEKIIYLKSAKHPLISSDVAIANDLIIDGNNQALVITGPNTGGKTVSLKTTGLLVLMHQSGLQIPVGDGSEIGFFSKVYADIGDEQSIQQSLSTFSSHIIHIKKILETIDESSLVLFDELGSGTDPSEGASLAVSILEFVLNKGSLVMATTHYNELKQYAYETENVQNASMDFDINSLEPTYRISYGIAGQSNAFAIARRIGLNESVIKSAETYNANHTLESERLFKTLEQEKDKLIQEKIEYEKEVEEYKNRIEKFENEKALLEKSKNKIISSAKKEAQIIINNAKKEMDEAIEEIKKLQKEATFASIVKAQSIKSQIEQKNKNSKNIENYSQNDKIPKELLKPGMLVYVRKLDDEGIITKYQVGDKEAYVELGSLKINIPIEDLYYPKMKSKNLSKNFSSQKSRSLKKDKSKSISTSIDLRGLLVEDALVLLDKYLDDAYLSSISEVSIIHGKGTGALRKAVNDYLKNNKRVLSYRFGTYHEGGNGNTIVTLK